MRQAPCRMRLGRSNEAVRGRKGVGGCLAARKAAAGVTLVPITKVPTVCCSVAGGHSRHSILLYWSGCFGPPQRAWDRNPFTPLPIHVVIEANPTPKGRENILDAKQQYLAGVVL